MVLGMRSSNATALAPPTQIVKPAAAPTTMAFNHHAGLCYKVLGAKRAITTTAEHGGKKVGQFKKNATFIAIEGSVNAEGELRVRSTRGWVTAKLADGTKLLEVETSAAGMDAASAKENAAAADLEAPPARRQRTMTVAHAERTAAMQEVFAPAGGTPTKCNRAAEKCATKGQVVPSNDDVLFLIATLRKDNPSLGVKKIVKEIQAREPMWVCGCKEVRAAIASA